MTPSPASTAQTEEAEICCQGQEGLVWGQNKETGWESQIPGLGRSPGGGHGNPFQYSCVENPHGQRSLAGYSPWGRKELRHD